MAVIGKGSVISVTVFLPGKSLERDGKTPGRTCMYLTEDLKPWFTSL